MSGTGRRLFFGFSLLVLAFAGASWSALRGMAKINDALHEIARREQSVRTVLLLSSAVRDQYAHIAHTLLLGNLSHRSLYEQARRRVDALLREVEQSPSPAEAREKLESIRNRAEQVDSLVTQEILPALARKEPEAAVAVHGRILELVGRIQADAERLATLHEEDIRAYEVTAADAQRRAFWWNLALLLGAVGLAVVVGAWIGRSISTPVGLLAAGAQRLQAGELGTQIALHSDDELGQLAQQFNRMSVALKEQQERLVQQERLASVGRLAAGVAHEINNPVGVILGYLKLLKGRADPSLQDDLRVVEQEASRCQEIVQGLLDLSRPAKVSLSRVRLSEVVEEVAQRLGEDARVPAARIEWEGDAVVEADANKVRQIVENLTRNAAQATGKDGRVHVAIASSNGQARLRIRDNGPGLSPEILPRLFEPFASTRDQGTGLGLAVSRALAQAQGGMLVGDNHPEGGAEFTLTLKEAST